MRTKTKTLNRFAFAGKGTVSGDMALDLLEAIEIIKEMRSFIEMLETLNSKEFNEHVRLLEKSKEYAESYNRQKRNTHPLKEGKTRGDVKPFTYSKKPNKPSKGQK